MKEVFSSQTDFTNELFTSKYMENSPFHNFQQCHPNKTNVETTFKKLETTKHQCLARKTCKMIMMEVFSTQTNLTNELFTSKYMENNLFHNLKQCHTLTRNVTTKKKVLKSTKHQCLARKSCKMIMMEVFSTQTDFTNELFTSKYMENNSFHNLKQCHTLTRNVSTKKVLETNKYQCLAR